MSPTKYTTALLLAFVFIAFGCKKAINNNTSNNGGSGGSVDTTKPNNTPVFVTYTIKKGQQYSDLNIYTPVSYTEQKFIVKFDSSAVYATVDTVNQYDINKLYGFSDSDSLHHVYSARFGWNYLNKKVWLYAYVYNNTALLKQTLSAVPIGSEISCSIKVNTNTYVFTINGVATTVPRLAKTSTGKGYRLYPFFGGTENAPHDIKIAIKEY